MEPAAPLNSHVLAANTVDNPLNRDMSLVAPPWTETAYDWMLRCRRRGSGELAPKGPSSAAWSFVSPARNNHSCDSSGTGIAFIDAALCKNVTPNSSLENRTKIPVIDIRGDYGKTWTLISLAARFVVATCQSQFSEISGARDDENQSFFGRSLGQLPQVIVLDSKYDFTIPKLSYAVRSTLLRKLGVLNHDNEANLKRRFERDIENCLSRIHIATSSNDVGGWIPILESIRFQLLPLASDHPTLILWDGFLGEPAGGDAMKMEVVRLLELLLRECSVLLVITSGSRYRKRDFERFVTHKIRLDRRDVKSAPANQCNRHAFSASVYSEQIPFSISLGGIVT